MCINHHIHHNCRSKTPVLFNLVYNIIEFGELLRDFYLPWVAKRMPQVEKKLLIPLAHMSSSPSPFVLLNIYLCVVFCDLLFWLFVFFSLSHCVSFFLNFFVRLVSSPILHVQFSVLVLWFSFDLLFTCALVFVLYRKLFTLMFLKYCELVFEFIWFMFYTSTHYVIFILVY